MESLTKVCTKCKQELPLESFRWKNKSQNKRHSQCRECQKKQEKQHYQESLIRRESVLKTAYNQKEKNLELVEQYKQIGCQKCGEKRLYVLDCHHTKEEDKLDNISKMIKSSSYKNLENELKKCVVLCSNCHAYSQPVFQTVFG